ncbi:hypothetical protein M422DRAFT_268772, partial [Sphaerobolus stellatus SS14]
EELCEGHQRCFGTLDQVYTGPKTSGDSKNDPRRTVAGFKKDKKYNAKAPDLNMPFLRRQEAKKMALLAKEEKRAQAQARQEEAQQRKKETAANKRESVIYTCAQSLLMRLQKNMRSDEARKAGLCLSADSKEVEEDLDRLDNEVQDVRPSIIVTTYSDEIAYLRFMIPGELADAVEDRKAAIQNSWTRIQDNQNAVMKILQRRSIEEHIPLTLDQTRTRSRRGRSEETDSSDEDAQPPKKSKKINIAKEK